MAPNSPRVAVMADTGMTKATARFVPSKSPSSQNRALEKTIPSPRPRAKEHAARSSVSRNRMWAMCRFSMPRMLYRPSSFFRRLMMKLLV